MVDVTDTRMIPLNEPLSEGVVKMLDEYVPWDADLSQETSDISRLADEEYSQPFRLTYTPEKCMSFYEWLGIAATRLSEPGTVALATALLFSEKLIIYPEYWTSTFDPDAIIRAVSEQKSAVASISPGLIMPRTQVQASSLLAPSGAYLTWIEMLAEDLDDQSP